MAKPKRKKNQTLREYKDSHAYQAWKASENPDFLKLFKVNRMVAGKMQIFWVRAMNAADARWSVEQSLTPISITPPYVPKKN